MNLRHLAITASMLGTLTIAASAYAAVSTEEFVQKASIANMFEIKTSKAALHTSDSTPVKDFAQKMVDDHTKTGEKMKEALASSQTDAKPADKLDSAHQKQLDSLKAKSGKDFDSSYIALQTTAHKQAVALFSDYAANGDDAALKQFASETLPDLKSHLKHVKQLSAAQQ